MYFSADQVKAMLGIIRDNFDNAYVLMECLCTKFVNKEHVEKSIQATGAVFTWGADNFDNLFFVSMRLEVEDRMESEKLSHKTGVFGLEIEMKLGYSVSDG